MTRREKSIAGRGLVLFTEVSDKLEIGDATSEILLFFAGEETNEKASSP